MGIFVGKLRIERVDSKHWKLLEPLTYLANDGRRIVVPAGFVADGASIPRLLWPIVGHPMNGKHAEASFVHDYLYATQAGKAYADLIFLEAMKTRKVSVVRRKSMYYAVKWFGHSAYNACKEDS